MKQKPQQGEGSSGGGDLLRIGRADLNELVIKDGAISAYHAQLERRGRRIVLKDLGSTNGSFVNGVRIKGSFTVTPEDELAVANIPISWEHPTMQAFLEGRLQPKVARQTAPTVGPETEIFGKPGSQDPPPATAQIPREFIQELRETKGPPPPGAGEGPRYTESAVSSLAATLPPSTPEPTTRPPSATPPPGQSATPPPGQSATPPPGQSATPPPAQDAPSSSAPSVAPSSASPRSVPPRQSRQTPAPYGEQESGPPSEQEASAQTPSPGQPSGQPSAAQTPPGQVSSGPGVAGPGAQGEGPPGAGMQGYGGQDPGAPSQRRQGSGGQGLEAQGLEAQGPGEQRPDWGEGARSRQEETMIEYSPLEEAPPVKATGRREETYLEYNGAAGMAGLVQQQGATPEPRRQVGMGAPPDRTEGTALMQMTTIKVGRAPDNDIVLNYPQISAYHCLLTPVSAESFRVEDLQSTNGTYIGNRSRQIQGSQEVHVSDVLYLGSFRFPVRQLESRLSSQQQQEAHASSFAQGELLSIGRNPQNDIVLEYPQISSFHARIYRDRDGRFAIEDLGSTNGTFVNGRRITEKTPVSVLDLILLGSYILELDEDGRVEVKDFRGDMRIDARDLIFEVKDRKTGKPLVLLDHISTTFYPSEFVGLMGPSGAGKTTLLLALNGYTPPTRGEVLVNGLDLYHNFDLFRGAIGYVPQDDIIHKELTVYQSLYYAALMRLPGDTKRARVRERLEEVLRQLELWEHRDKIIGTPEDKVLSGGQRKRVNLAMELVTDPSILFLDEPTSGLSSRDTENVMGTLRRLADNGKTIILTIHQPSPKVYGQMDNLLLLHRGGRLAYYGPTKPDSFEYFKAQGRSADEIMEALESTPAEKMQQQYLDSPLYREFVVERQQGEDQRVQTSGKPSPRAPRGFGLSQWLLLTRRYLRVKVKDTLNTLVLLLQAPIIGALTSFVFAGTTSRITRRADLETPLFILGLAAIWFGCSNAAREIVSERAIYLRERMVNLKIPSYLFSKFFILSLLCLAQCAVLLGICHPILGFRQPFWKHLAVLFLTAECGLALGFFISSMVRSAEAAMALLPLLLLPQIILGGFVVNLEKANPVIRWSSYGMISRWSFEALVNTEKPSGDYTIIFNVPELVECKQEDDDSPLREVPEVRNLYKELGLHEGVLRRNVGALGGFLLAFLLGAMFFLKRKDPSF